MTFDITPFADKIQIARGPCCEKEMILMVISFNQTKTNKGVAKYKNLLSSEM